MKDRRSHWHIIVLLATFSVFVVPFLLCDNYARIFCVPEFCRIGIMSTRGVPLSLQCMLFEVFEY
jgi:hypothetical protein